MGRSVLLHKDFFYIQQQKTGKVSSSVKFVNDFMSFSVKLTKIKNKRKQREIIKMGRSVARHLTNNNRIYDFLETLRCRLRCRFQLLCKILVFGLR